MIKAKYRLSTFRGIVAFLFLGLLLCTCSIHTQAASNYKKTYEKILKRGYITVKHYGGYKETVSTNYFRLLDINRDGTKELIISQSEFTDYIYIFTLKKGKVRFVEECHNKYMNAREIRYSKKYKGIVLANGGSGAAGDSIWKLKNGTMTEAVSLMKDFNRKTRYYYNGKPVSKNTYRLKWKKYFKKGTVKTVKLYKNTSKNRKERLK